MKKIVVLFFLTLFANLSYAELTDEQEAAAQAFIAAIPNGAFLQDNATILKNLRKKRLVLLESRITEAQKATMLEKITTLDFLEKVHLSGFQFTEFPDELLSLTQLKTLVMIGTRFTSIPDEIADLENLTALELIHGQLRDVPASIGELANLKRLSLESNHLKTLPSEIKQLNLIELNLSDNPLQTFTDRVQGDDGQTQLKWGYADLSNRFSKIRKLKIDKPSIEQDAPSGLGGGAAAAAAAPAAEPSISAAEHRRVQEELRIHTEAYRNVTRQLDEARKEIARLRAENAELRRGAGEQK